MYLFYGIDNYLVNKAVAAFINKKKQNNYDYQIINFYLDSETAIKTFIDIWQLLQKSDIFDSEKIIIINDYFDFLYYHGADCVEFIQLLQTKIKNSTIIIKIFNNKITTLTAFFKTKKMIIFPVVSYTEEDLKTWFDQQIKKYQIKLKTQALMINKLPLQLTIIKNELKKWQFFQDEIVYSTILKSFEKYYDVAVSELFENLLFKKYDNFWKQYYHYWENSNFDKLRLLTMFANYLELIRNVKLAISNKWTNKEITTFFFISEYKLAIISKYKWNIKQINLLILKIHDIEYKLKSGKYFKNLVIDSFFLNICDIII